MAILAPLRELDEVAYLRFAAVYKQFESAEDFEIEIAALRKHRAEQLAELLESESDGPHLSPRAADHRPPGTSWGSGVPGDPPRCRLCPCAVSVPPATLISRDHDASSGTRETA